jgi:hypothetical protein
MPMLLNFSGTKIFIKFLHVLYDSALGQLKNDRIKALKLGVPKTLIGLRNHP